MLKFLKKVKTLNPVHAGPIVVHCRCVRPRGPATGGTGPLWRNGQSAGMGWQRGRRALRTSPAHCEREPPWQPGLSQGHGWRAGQHPASCSSWERSPSVSGTRGEPQYLKQTRAERPGLVMTVSELRQVSLASPSSPLGALTSAPGTEMETTLPPGAPRSFWKSSWGWGGGRVHPERGKHSRASRAGRHPRHRGLRQPAPLGSGPCPCRRGSLGGARVWVSGGCHHGHPLAVEKQVLKGL